MPALKFGYPTDPQTVFDAIKAKILDAAPKGLREDEFNRYIGPAMAQAIGEAENSAKPLDGSAIARFASGAWKNVNPMGIVKAVSHPIATLGEIAASSSERSAAAVKALREGRYSDAATNAVGAVPVVGPAMVSAGERIGSGDYAGGAGEAVGLIASLESPRLAKGAVGGVNRAATKVATSVGAQQALGAVAGTAAGEAVGHPYIGMGLGTKYGGPVVKSMAEGVEGLTGGRKTIAPTTAAEAAEVPTSQGYLTAAEKAQLRRLHYPEVVIDRMDKTPPKVSPLPRQQTPIDTPTPAEPKLTLSADESRIGLHLVKAGKTADEAVAHILALRKLRGGPAAGLPNDAEVAEVVAEKNARTAK